MNCIQCGETVDPDFSFCEACGAAVGAPSVNAPAPEVTSNSNATQVASSTNQVICKCGHTEFDQDNICENCGRRTEIADPIEVQILDEHTISATHRGRRHTENQDSVSMVAIDGAIAMALADGVSTSCHARQAADVAVTVALTSLENNPGLPIKERLELAIASAHDAVCKLAYDDTSLAEPEATLVLALIEGDQVHFAWVGDSRLYAVNQASQLLLTEDDSWFNQQIKLGLNVTTAMMDNNAHCITQCLGMRDDILDIHTGSARLDGDTYIVLCSDGLWNYCEAPAALHRLFDADLPLVNQCTQLIDFANDQGGHDNISLIVHRQVNIQKLT
ncbi:serine/threonine protein phosphatase PrpC [Undibacterium sp. GrIS 1.8]|uniref:PP2C family protein-serine/threonine phosphatase n=1 Tax=unclassified Undibacterium TaxID=2630295 RepID=UPI00339B00C9